MSRINTNVSSLIAQRILRQQNFSLTKSLERLSTGLAINRGADNPAGLIASENLRSEKAAISAAIGNAERADQVVNIAEGGLQEINSLLLEIQGLVGQSANQAGLSLEEKEANQLQIDSILGTIDRIASSTSFQGVKLLNGTFDFTVSAQASFVTDFQINGAKLAFGENREVQVLVIQSAQHAGLFLSTDGNILLDGDDTTAQLVFEVAGAKGSREFAFASATTTSAIRDAINTFTSVTGVSATVSATGGGVLLKSNEFGSDQFVSVKVIDDGGVAGGIALLSSTDENTVSTTGFTTFASVQAAIRDAGQDVGAIINGITAVAKGRTASVATDFLDVSVELNTSGAQTLATVDAFTITGGGAVFNLGPNVDITNQVSIGIANVAA
ncbi:MAG: flagellin, partial [Phycisphaeraceae bacterium]